MKIKIFQKIIISLMLIHSVNSFANDTLSTVCNGIDYQASEGILIYFWKNMNYKNKLWFGDQLTIIDGMDDTESLVRYKVDALFSSLTNGKVFRKIRLKLSDYSPQEGNSMYIFITPVYGLNGNLEKLIDVQGTTISGTKLSSRKIYCVTD